MTKNIILSLCVIGIILILTIIYACISINKRYKHAKEHKRVKQLLPIIKQQQMIHKQQLIEEQPHIKFINNMKRDFIRTRDAKILLSIGDFYHKGMFPVMKSDNHKARIYYNRAFTLGSKDIKQIAKGKLAEVEIDRILEVDEEGEEVNERTNEHTHNLLNDPRNYEDIPDDIQFIRINHVDVPRVQAQVQEQAQDEEHPVFLNDLQNVHDHYMNKITKANIDKLRSMNKPLDKNIIETLTHELTKDDSIDTNNKAVILNVLGEFKNNKQFECTELESLQLVYAFIQDHEDRDVLLHNLFLQLLDCMEYNIVVCTTGKISRVISMISHLDDFDDAKNIYYIKPELEQLASKVRDDILAELTPEQVNLYNTNGEGSDDIVNRMKQEYTDRVMKEYCTKLNIELDIIKPHLDANLEVF